MKMLKCFLALLLILAGCRGMPHPPGLPVPPPPPFLPHPR